MGYFSVGLWVKSCQAVRECVFIDGKKHHYLINQPEKYSKLRSAKEYFEENENYDESIYNPCDDELSDGESIREVVDLDMDNEVQFFST